MKPLSRPKNVPNLMLHVQRYLLEHGFGSLRFYSYIKEGLSTLRVVWYFEMQEQGRYGEPFAYPLWMESFTSFDSYGLASYWKNCIQGELSVEGVAEVIKTKIDAFAEYQSKPSIEYLSWFDDLLAACGNNGFPITEEPHLQAFGAEGKLVECVSDDRSWVKYLPSPPGFSATTFPYREYEAWLCQHERDVAEATHKANYAEWKRGVAGIRNGRES